MNDQDALYRAILAAPDDDAPRLIYADWLDENDQPERAEFIRVQVEQARLPWYEPRHRELDARATTLLAANFMAWMLPHPFARQEFHRGFVESVRFESIEDWHASPERLSEIAPIREIQWDTAALTRSVVERIVADRIERFHLHARVDVHDHVTPALQWLPLRTFVSSRWPDCMPLLNILHYPDLDDLRLTAITAGVREVIELTTQVNLARFRRLELTLEAPMDFSNRWHATHVRQLFDRSNFQNLDHLSFNGQAIGDAGLLAIVRHGALPNLAELHLEGNEIGETDTSGLEELLSEKVPNLKVLNLAGNPLGLSGVRELAVWPGLRNLRYLNLVGCQIPDAGIRRLLASPSMHAGLWLLHDADVS